MADLPHRLWRKVPHGMRRALFSSAGLALGAAASRRADASAQGPVTVAGAFGAPTGLGEAARLLLAGFAASGRPTHAFDLTRALKQTMALDVGWLPPPPPEGPGVVMIVQNPPVAAYALHLMGAQMLAGKRLIGHWVWEYGRTPPGWAGQSRLFHAVAAPSLFCQQIFGDLGRPVAHLPYPVALDPRWSQKRPEPRRDGTFRIGFIGDLIAAAGRKNPMDCVDAVALAFPGDKQVELILALGGGEPGHPVRQALEGRAATLGVNLTVDDRHLDANAHGQRLAGFDAFLSLHRAEGFGLSVAEAMLLGLPTVATAAPPMDELLGGDGWSVPWEPEAAPPTLEDSHPGDWARPDLLAAAQALQAIRADPQAATRRAERGRARLRQELGSDAFSAAAQVLLSA